MTRKSLFVAVAILALLAGGIAGALFLLVRHEPDFYHRTALPAGHERQQRSKEFYARFTQLLNAILNDRVWEERFTDEQINSYFDEDFVRSGVNEKILPEGISEPRVVISPDKIRLAFRYGVDPWSTVISIDLRVWMAAGEPNVVALELQGLYAGSLPIAAQSLLECVSEVARRQNIEVTWYRHNRHPVALLRFQADQPRATVQLQKVELQQGAIVIRGRSTEGFFDRAAAVPALLHSAGN